jgi:hypothetical protein
MNFLLIREFKAKNGGNSIETDTEHVFEFPNTVWKFLASCFRVTLGFADYKRSEVGGEPAITPSKLIIFILNFTGLCI